MRLAVLQTAPNAGGAAEALAALDAGAAEAAAAGAALMVAPEMLLSGYAIGPDAARAAAEPPDGPSLKAAAAIARARGVGLCFGFPELGAEGDVYNAAALIDRTGALRSIYRKAHLFGDVDRSQFSPGGALPEVVSIEGWGVAMGICYDIEFPEFARAATLAGAEALLIPTANMHPFVSVCDRIVPARAEENGVYVAYANHVGPEGPFDYCGRSCISGPDGADLARAEASPGLLVAELSMERLAAARANAAYLADRRPELYGAVAEKRA
jgi:predicted amidohydrolase